MKIEGDKRVDVLLAALGERYTSLHKIRDRVESIGIWGMGLSLGAGGWFLQSHEALSCTQKTITILGVLGALAVLRFVYLADLRRGFCGQQRAAVRVERTLGLFSIGAFDNTDESIYPEKWKNAGTEKTDGRFFNSTYALLNVATAFLVLSILISGSFSK